MAFQFTLSGDPGLNTKLIQDVNYALGQWSNLIQAPGRLDVRIEVSADNVIRAGAPVSFDPTGTYYTPFQVAKPVFMTSAAAALLNLPIANNDPIPGVPAGPAIPGGDIDMVLRFDPTYLANEVFLDGTPTTSNDIPNYDVDAISVINHEIAHALGMTGFFPRDAAGRIDADSVLDLPNQVSTFDQWVRFDGTGSPVFAGPNAMAANGGQPVKLTDIPVVSSGATQNIYHLDAPAGTEVMNGWYMLQGTRYPISALDRAIIKDVTGLSAAPTTQIAFDPKFNVTPEVARGTSLPPLQKLGPTLAFNPPTTEAGSLGDLFADHMTANDLLPSFNLGDDSGNCHAYGQPDQFGRSMTADLMSGDQPNWLTDLARAA